MTKEEIEELVVNQQPGQLVSRVLVEDRLYDKQRTLTKTCQSLKRCRGRQEGAGRILVKGVHCIGTVFSFKADFSIAVFLPICSIAYRQAKQSDPYRDVTGRLPDHPEPPPSMLLSSSLTTSSVGKDGDLTPNSKAVAKCTLGCIQLAVMLSALPHHLVVYHLQQVSASALFMFIVFWLGKLSPLFPENYMGRCFSLSPASCVHPHNQISCTLLMMNKFTESILVLQHSSNEYCQNFRVGSDGVVR